MKAVDMLLHDAIECAIRAEEKNIRLERTVAFLILIIFALTTLLFVR